MVRIFSPDADKKRGASRNGSWNSFGEGITVRRSVQPGGSEMTWKSCKGLEVLLPICLAFARSIGEISSNLYEVSADVALFLDCSSSYVEAFPVCLSGGAQHEE